MFLGEDPKRPKDECPPVCGAELHEPECSALTAEDASSFVPALFQPENYITVFNLQFFGNSLPLPHPLHPSEAEAKQVRHLPGQFAQADELQGQEQPLLMQRSGSGPGRNIHSC